MGIFLVQHGQAKSKAEDPLRPLNPEGSESVVRIGKWAHIAGVHVKQIRHSGKLRAKQTAQILTEHLKPSGGCINVSGLGSNDDVVPMGEIAANELQDIMIVGHLPFLSRLAGFLVTGDPETQIIRFCNAGIVCLLEEQGSWSINWVMTPDLLL